VRGGPNLWTKCLGGCGMHAADAGCTRPLRKACGADAMRQAEESSSTLVESQAFSRRGKKRGLSGRKCTRF
jgi:hypothetical protein